MKSSSHRDIITIGGSAGSIQPLVRVITALPKGFSASIFVVIHRRALERSQLPRLLGMRSNLPVADAIDGEPIRSGRVYIAPPDDHLLINEGHLHLSHGPKEGLHRPSINTTFRSAAMAYGGRVIGILLSGLLDDGASGLWDIVNQGGISIIQHPEEAQFPSMPLEALQGVPINYKLWAAEIAPALVGLASGSDAAGGAAREYVNDVSPDNFSGFACLECSGPLFNYRSKPQEFKCRTGHVFPLRTLVEESASTQERKLHEALVSMEEGVDLAEFAEKQASPNERGRIHEDGKRLREQCVALRNLIEGKRTTAAGEGDSGQAGDSDDAQASQQAVERPRTKAAG